MLHLAVFLPLIGFLIAGIGGSRIGHKGCEYITSGILVLAALLSWIIFANFDVLRVEPIAMWISSGHFAVEWSLRLDRLSSVMLVVVNSVSALVHIYSIGYMHNDPHRSRFFAYLSLFTFAMLILVTSNNLIQLFFGWEGVGLASYLLIGFWYNKPAANAAAIKAFVVNRIGDFGFILGIFGVFVLFQSVDFTTIFGNVATLASTTTDEPFTFVGYTLSNQSALNIVCLLLFMGAMGKSAQFLLHTWLPDAMEGPTPVSALIHAATMVTAGVFLVARLSPIFEFAPIALTFITFIGATTAFFAASIALVQNDIKRVIAYSTCSQLGYMFAALGVGAYGAAIFHLFTHAFFKALLFLGAGSVIHAVGNEQDMRRMGGLARHIPKTYVMMLVGTVALTGLGLPTTVLGTAGFFSKDAIIESLYVGQNAFAGYAFWLTLFAACLTSFYSWRLIFMTFHGRPRASPDTMSHVHESPNVMLIPLYLLAIGAIFAGFVYAPSFIGEHHEAGHLDSHYLHFWDNALYLGSTNTILENFHYVPTWVKSAPFVMMIIGFALAWQFYIKSPYLPQELARQHPGLYKFLLNKWYFDELYDLVFTKGAHRLAKILWKTGDGRIIDGLGPDGISKLVLRISAYSTRLQTGYLYHYAFAMLIGVSFLVTAMMFYKGF